MRIILRAGRDPRWLNSRTCGGEAASGGTTLLWSSRGEARRGLISPSVRLTFAVAVARTLRVYEQLRVIAMAPVLNEERHIGEVIRRTPRDVVDEVLMIDDGCTDNSPHVASELGATVLSMGRVVGVGAALRAGFDYAVEHRYDVVVVLAGNNKDAPEEIPILVDPIANGRADFVQGSRFLKRHANFGAMPAYRRVATRVHPLVFSLVARRWVTESTNGFRAIHRRILTDPRINLAQPWLDEYGLEPYLYLKVTRLGYRTIEVPVTKVYPPKELGQTKMRPITGWWSILRPLVYVGLGVKD